MSTDLIEIIKDKLEANKVTFSSETSSGCINDGRCLVVDDELKIFVKTNSSQHASTMFHGEFESLRFMQATKAIAVPKPILVLPEYDNELKSAILIEYLGINKLDASNSQKLGVSIANLHDYNRKHIAYIKRTSSWIGNVPPSRRRDDDIQDNKKEEEQDEGYSKRNILNANYSKQADGRDDATKVRKEDIIVEQFRPSRDLKPVEKFGFECPTSCGLLPQTNEWTDDWIAFFSRYRLDLPIRQVLQEYGDRKLNELWSFLQVKVDKLFNDFEKDEEIVPSLLHGDLWSGNVGQLDDDKTPVVFDPASFYGHHEYEFGISRMFGGIDREFEKGYFEIINKKKRFEDRNKLYQLFHHLNHWNHFGTSYKSKTLSLFEEVNKLV